VITGLGHLTAPSLGAYQLTVGFDPAILSVSGVVFGDPLLGDQLDLSFFGTLAGWSLLLSNLMEFNETSFDSISTLESGRAGDFTLATLSFDVLARGTSPLTLGIGSLSDASGVPLDATTVNGSITAVPEPTGWLLLGTGFAALGPYKSRR